MRHTSNCIVGHVANMIGYGGVTYKQTPHITYLAIKTTEYQPKKHTALKSSKFQFMFLPNPPSPFTLHNIMQLCDVLQFQSFRYKRTCKP